MPASRTARTRWPGAGLAQRRDSTPSRAAGLHRRDLGQDQHGASLRPRGERMRMGRPHGPLEDLDLRRRLHPQRHDRPLRARPADQSAPPSRPTSKRCWSPNFDPPTSSSWTTCPAPLGRGCAKASMPPAPRSSSCRLTHQTLTRSSWPSPNSRRCSERPQSEPTTAPWIAIARILDTPISGNAETTSPPQDMVQPNRILL